jgi:hypothetical protein
MAMVTNLNKHLEAISSRGFVFVDLKGMGVYGSKGFFSYKNSLQDACKDAYAEFHDGKTQNGSVAAIQKMVSARHMLVLEKLRVGIPIARDTRVEEAWTDYSIVYRLKNVDGDLSNDDIIDMIHAGKLTGDTSVLKVVQLKGQDEDAGTWVKLKDEFNENLFKAAPKTGATGATTLATSPPSAAAFKPVDYKVGYRLFSAVKNPRLSGELIESWETTFGITDDDLVGWLPFLHVEDFQAVIRAGRLFGRSSSEAPLRRFRFRRRRFT